MRFFQYWYIILFFLAACSDKKSGQQVKQGEIAFVGYQFNEPTEVFELPDDLEEISGLTAVSGSYLLCNEDEKGKLYLFNLEEGKVEEELNWGEKGDYEGLSLIEETAYVLKSNGMIYRISDYLSPAPEVTEMQSGLDNGCDAEGLTALPGKKSLLIACKEGSAETRNLYELDLEEGILRNEPYLQLNLAEIEDYLASSGLDKLSLELKKMLDPKGSSGVLFPSGIAFHPQTNDLYILSAKSKLLLVYSEGELKEAINLTHKLFRQPESITFTPNGDLFIGNEGKGGKANILKFEYDQQ